MQVLCRKPCCWEFVDSASLLFLEDIYLAAGAVVVRVMQAFHSTAPQFHSVPWALGIEVVF